MNSQSVVYIAHHGDVPEYQAVFVVDQPEDASEELIHKTVISTFRACLVGWFSAQELPDIATECELENNLIVAVPSGYVLRVTEADWTVYSVDYGSDDLLEAYVKKIDFGRDRARMPSGWPLYMQLG